MECQKNLRDNLRAHIKRMLLPLRATALLSLLIVAWSEGVIFMFRNYWFKFSYCCDGRVGGCVGGFRVT